MTLYQSTQILEAERSVIGSVFLDNHVLDNIYFLQPEDFYLQTHQLLWKGIKYLYLKDEPIDLVTMTEVLQTYKRLDEVGGVTYLTEIASSVPTTANVTYYAKIVQRQGIKRRVMEAAEKIQVMADDFEDIEEYLSAVEREILMVRPENDEKMVHVKDSMDDFIQYLNEKNDFVKTGFRNYDEFSGGIARGDLYILAGRPSVGKTAKMLQMAKHISTTGAGDVLIYSQEMGTNQLKSRLLSSMSGVNAKRIRRKVLSEEEKQKVIAAHKELNQYPIYIEDIAGVTIEHVQAVARRMKRKHGKIGSIIVDYLQIMKIPQSKGTTRSQAVGVVTKKAKQIARELDCPFIMLAQLNRDGTGEPGLHHLRDSGEIEQDADVVEFLWEDPDDTDPNGKVVQSTIAKGRDIGTNRFRYLFQGWTQTFKELD